MGKQVVVVRHQPSKVLALVLLVFLGGLGVHRMYTGHWFRAIVFLCLGIGTVFTGGVLAVVLLPLLVLDGVLLLFSRLK